ncbi:MAG: MarR family transcriptional regulator [Gracilibacteraceae bacterium]|jgi:DNA-binding MarR family transcriptional regulator|nr:MarR family transcriptional regulator [Gracilibacteraceae bacterium]
MAFRLDDSLGFVLGRTNVKLKNALIQSLKEYDITPEQWGVLNRLWENDGITPKRIAESLTKDIPTTVRILDLLEQKELVFREDNPVDGRSFLVRLTKAGFAGRTDAFSGKNSGNCIARP